MRPIPGPTSTAEGDKKQEENESGFCEEERKEGGKNCRSRKAGNRTHGRGIKCTDMTLAHSSWFCRTRWGNKRNIFVVNKQGVI